MRRLTGIAVALLLLHQIVQVASAADTKLFLGEWTNIDKDTGGIRRLVISGPEEGDRLRVQAFGACQPDDCDWGTTSLHLYSNSVSSDNYHYATATFNTASSTVVITLELRDKATMDLRSYARMKSRGRNNYSTKGTFRRASRRPARKAPARQPRTRQRQEKKEPAPTRRTAPRTEPAASIREDCIPFDPDMVKHELIRGQWVVTSGDNYLIAFGSKGREALEASRILKHYRFNRYCFVSRASTSLEYFLVSGRAARAGRAGDDCVSFNPKNLTVKNVRGNWVMADGDHGVHNFGTRQSDARKAVTIIRKYGFTKLCYVGRPDSSMTYLLR